MSDATETDPGDAHGLRLGPAMQLLAQSGRTLPDVRRVGEIGWMQALLDAMCDLSCCDPLTGLANRRRFEMSLASEVDRVARAGEPALVLMIDIDHFKSINDRHGHAAGDTVLKGVAQVLHDCIRPMDTLARIGGEEFAMILPNCPPSFGPTVAERVRRKVAESAISIAPALRVGVTVSIGGAFAPQWVRSSASLWVERADRELYRAKGEGRNRACLEQPTVSPVSAEEKGLLFGTSSFQELE